MKHKLFIFFTLLISLSSYGQGLEIPVKKKECKEQIIVHSGYTVSYNEDLLIPNWVAYELTEEEVNGQFPRRGAFCPDPDVKGRSAVTYDYSNSGWDRGHMAPAADLKWSEQSMLESFYLSNICPQDRGLNGGIWLGLEEAVRDWARKEKNVFVVCGPLMEKTYLTIGENRVAVPSGFFKVVCKCVKGAYFTIGFIFPNKDVSGSIFDYSCSVNEVERISGYDFFSLMPDKTEEVVESTCRPIDWKFGSMQ